MKRGILAGLFLVIASACSVTPAIGEMRGKWNAQQQSIIDFSESCSNEYAMEIWLNCYHQDYFGWYRSSPTPLSFADKKALALTWQWGKPAGEGEPNTSEYLSVNLYGNTAIMLSIESYPANDYYPGSPPLKERWTTVLVRQDDTWKVLSEHVDPIQEE
jgi:hypothetical protein